MWAQIHSYFYNIIFNTTLVNYLSLLFVFMLLLCGWIPETRILSQHKPHCTRLFSTFTSQPKPRFPLFPFKFLSFPLFFQLIDWI